MPKVARGKSMWPPPVYEGRFADGTSQRMSFYSLAGKPIDFARGRRGACLRGCVIGGNKHSQRSINASDIIAGHVEIGEETYADPYFDKTTSVPALGKIKVSALDKVLAQIANLSHEDRGALIVALTT